MQLWKGTPIIAPRERRAAKRREVDVPVQARELGSFANGCIATDLSSSGCQLFQCDFKEGDELWISFPGAEPMRARVVWAAGWKAGCVFYRPLPNALVARIAFAHRPGRTAE